MWKWLKSIWEDKKAILIKSIDALLDTQKPKLAAFITLQKDKITPTELASAIIDDIKDYIRKRL